MSRKEVSTDRRRISVDDREYAEKEILKYVLKCSYSNEYECLSRGHEVKRGSTLACLDVFMDDDLIRVGGRLCKSDLPYDCKYPVVLPSAHTVTTMIVRYFHERVGHLGVSTVLARGYSTVRRVIGRCVVCRKVQGRVVEQKMANLPLERVMERAPVFSCTGVDCFGPFFVTFGRGRKRIKRYGVLFTCMAVRAVHLEGAYDLSADAILSAMRRFVARRGQVRLFCSDNGTNFVGARRELLVALTDPTVRDGVENRGIRWEFNPPKASHFGGIWERVIRTVRRVLEAVFANKVFTDDSLSTLFCEAEAAVNSRPLTIVGNDPGVNVLTPQNLLNLGTYVDSWSGVPSELPDNIKRWKHIQSLADQFWRRWCREYRSSLQGRHKWAGKRRNLVVGDVVLVVDELVARCQWPLGRVTAVKTSADGLVRSVTLVSRGKVYNRPVAKLVLLVEGAELP